MSNPPQTQLLDCLQPLLTRHFSHLSAATLTPDTHLLDDLGLDSVELMQILVLLETEHGIELPDTALDYQQISTVHSLTQLLISKGPAAQEAELDIKVHCVVSCLCHPLKRAGLDHRPMYFGVWDAPVFVNDAWQLSYHAEGVDHLPFTSWFGRLYGVKVHEWYNRSLSKEANLEHLYGLLKQRRASQQILVMLDMFLLPERENRFNRDPFPHYVILEEMADTDQLWMWDADFRWEGALDRERVMRAVASPAVAGGYQFDAAGLREAPAEDVAAYFEQCFQLQHNGLTDAVKRIVMAHASGAAASGPVGLGAALSELPVLAIRKYAYEHGLAYFLRALGPLGESFERWCEKIEVLVRGFDQVLYLANKYALNGDPGNLSILMAQVEEQNRRERIIKEEIHRSYHAWRTARCLKLHQPTIAQVAL